MQTDATPTRRRPEQATATPGIYRRGTKYVVRVKDARGRSLKRSADTLKAAQILKSALVADIARGDYKPQSGTTFGAYADTWIATYRGRTSKGIRPATIAGYKAMLDTHARPYFGRMRLADIEPADVRSYAQHLVGKGLARNTIRLALAPVKLVLATAVEDGLVRSNVATGVRFVAEKHEHDKPAAERALTTEQAARLVAKLPERRRLLVEFLLQSGLRIGEAVALRWMDADLGALRIHVTRSYYRGTMNPPKSRYGVRSVPISEAMARRLWQARDGAADDLPVFPNTRGGLLDAVNVYNRDFKPAARAVGVDWAGWHTLRHTCATELFGRGLNAKQVQVWLGHHSAAFTLSVYVHMLSDDLPDADFWDTPGVPLVSPPEEMSTQVDTPEAGIGLVAG
jgi:integrase